MDTESGKSRGISQRFQKVEIFRVAPGFAAQEFAAACGWRSALVGARIAKYSKYTIFYYVNFIRFAGQ